MRDFRQPHDSSRARQRAPARRQQSTSFTVENTRGRAGSAQYRALQGTRYRLAYMTLPFSRGRGVCDAAADMRAALFPKRAAHAMTCRRQLKGRFYNSL